LLLIVSMASSKRPPFPPSQRNFSLLENQKKLL
jgi:hypothetical protein